MSPACVRAGILVERRRSGLGDADRLWLETHLSDCADCARRAETLDSLAGAMRAADWELSASQRRRTIERAVHAPRQREHAELGRSRVRWVGALAAAFAVLVALSAWQLAEEPGRLDRGVGRLATSALSPQAPRKSAAEVERFDAPPRTRLELGGARIEVQQRAVLRWRTREMTLELVTGAVRVEVTPRSERPFRVATDRMQVEVLGTMFDVDLTRVSVSRGRVRVSTPAGDRLATLEAGQSFELEAATKPGAARRPNVDTEITRARSELALGKVKNARVRLLSLSREKLSAGQDAEVKSLLAECSLIEGDAAAAARAYGEVAERHRGSLAGETALFTKARAEIRANRKAEARASLHRYLERYPNGRFRAEALRHLRNLENEK